MYSGVRTGEFRKQEKQPDAVPGHTWVWDVDDPKEKIMCEPPECSWWLYKDK